jgi:hypothetical protein
MELDTVTCQRVDDEHVRRRRIAFGLHVRNLVRGVGDLDQRRGQPHRLADDARAGKKPACSAANWSRDTIAPIRYRETLHERRAQASIARGYSWQKTCMHTRYQPRLRCWPLSLIALGASPARAERCDDIATQLKNQIDGLKVGITATKTIYLSHPQARELSLGCSGRNFKNELYAKADGGKPKPAFLDLVGSAAAIIFSLPKDTTLTGAKPASSGWGCSAATLSRCAIAASTLNAPVPRPRRRLRSCAARMSEEARA